jgi:glutathione S-transferase
MALKLYAHPLSSYSQKAIIAFYELALPFEPAMVGVPATYAELVSLWPFGKFPVLVDGDQTIPEATVIIEHLDQIAGGGKLIPRDAKAALEARLIDRVIDNYVATPQQGIVDDLLRDESQRDPRRAEAARAALDKSYAWLVHRLAGRAWAAGEAFTLADCGAAPMLFYADWFHPIAPRHPTLADYLTRLRDRPSVRRTVEEGRPYWNLVPGGVPAHVN